MFKPINESLIIGVDFSETDVGVLVVGRKSPKRDVTIINVFQGEEARELYDKLTTPAKGNKNGL